MQWFVALGIAVGAAAGVETDIKGPLPPLELEERGLPVRRLVAAGVGVGFVAVGAYFLWRRRRRVTARRLRRPAPAQMPDLAGLETPEFYARLLDAARDALDRRAEAHPRTLTPRELAALQPPGLTDGPEAVRRWHRLCNRAEQALYAATPVQDEKREADRQLVLEILRRLRGSREAQPADPEEEGG
jgi:hypothetical protein